jgi:hypothetical protein
MAPSVGLPGVDDLKTFYAFKVFGVAAGSVQFDGIHHRDAPLPS